MEIRAAREGEQEEIIDLLAEVFATQCRLRYASQIYQDSSYHLEQSRVGLVEGKIVSHLRISDRVVCVDDTTVKLAGVGMVATQVDYRQRGYASALIIDAISYMEKHDYDLSLLFTTIQPFYQNFDWSAFPQTTVEFPLELGETFPLSPWECRQFEIDTDLKSVMQIYQKCRHSGSIVRSLHYWRDGYAQQVGIIPSLVIEDSGQILAYANLCLGVDDSGTDPFLAQGYPNLREVGWTPDRPESLLILSRAILNQAIQQKISKLTGHLPPYHPLTVMLIRESQSTPSFSINQKLMYRTVSLPKLLSKMKPTLQSRLDQSSFYRNALEKETPDGVNSFCITVASQACTLQILSGRLEVLADQSGATKVLLSPDEWIRILFGDLTFPELQNLRVLDQLDISDSELQILNLLFPKSQHLHSVCDYF